MTRSDGSTIAEEAMAADRPAAMAPAAVDDGRVILPDVTDSTLDDPFIAFDEWDSEADRSAIAGL